MRMPIAILVVACTLAGAAQKKGNKTEPFVLLHFADQHVYVFVVDEDKLSAFQTRGTNLEIAADCGKHMLEVSGSGEMTYKTHRFSFSPQGGVAVDGKQLPAASRSFLLLPNGTVQEGFVRTFDREPHKK